MIATRFEDPRRRVGEETYALARILVRRLQKATRGIPRRERVERHLRFADEWRAFSTDGRLGEVRRALATGEPKGASPDSFLVQLAVDCREGQSPEPEFTQEPGDPGESGAPGLDSRWSEKGSRQAELFEPELIPYPV